MATASAPARPRSVKTREATEAQRVEMHTLYHCGKWSLERIGKELGFHATTVGRIVKIPLVAPRKTSNRGRHRLLSAEAVDNLIELGTKDAHHRGLSFASLGTLAGINASERVIREALLDAGYDRRIAAFETGSNKGPKKGKWKGQSTDGNMEVEMEAEVAEGYIEGVGENSDKRDESDDEVEAEDVREVPTILARGEQNMAG